MPTNNSRGLLERVLLFALALAGLIAAIRTPDRRSTTPAGVDPEDLAVGYERSDGNARLIIASLVSLVVVIGVIVAGVSALEGAVAGAPVTLTPPRDLLDGVSNGPTPQPPRLENQPGVTAPQNAERQAQLLTTYRWIDRQSGTVAIPIDRAIDLVATDTADGSPTPAPGPRP
jgi:hypothetical protein